MTYRAAKLRYITLRAEAMATAWLELRDHLPDGASLSHMSSRSDVAWYSQWQPINDREPPNGGWHWPNRFAHYKERPENLCVAMWSRNEQELCGMLVARLNRTAAVVDAIEGSPKVNHSLTGKVLLLGLETAARYAQITGRRELWLMEPSNKKLTRLYVGQYGFEYVTPQKGVPFCRREV